jgi:hypothetical protein
MDGSFEVPVAREMATREIDEKEREIDGEERESERNKGERA